MAKEFKVFFSWQSDLPANQTRFFIEESIEMAKSLLPDSIILIPDEATRNRLGSPDIMNSIFEKIDECDLFVADVSIVGQYSLPAEESEDLDIKYLPNPNVLLELGYAAARISWDRCICLANTKYGEISQLPFDLNHRRITDFSYAGSTRKQKVAEIAEIIKSTVISYVDMPIAKSGFSHHIVGGFNFETGVISEEIIPYNKIAFESYCDHTNILLEKIKNTIDVICQMHLPPKEETVEGSPSNAFESPNLPKEFTLQLTKAHDVKVDRNYLCENVKEYFGFELNDSFYHVGNLQEITSVIPHIPPSLEGTDLEKEKYALLQNLESDFAKIKLREIFQHLFDDILIVPLAIKNTSTKNDERMLVSIQVVRGLPISPTSSFFDADYIGCEGYVCEDQLISELLQLPENSTIRFDSAFLQNALPHEVPRFHMPTVDVFGYASEPSFDAEDYEEELQNYIQCIDAGTNDEYSFSVGALRPNETVWLGKPLLIKPIEGEIILKYSIKSNNTTGTLSGTLYL